LTVLSGEFSIWRLAADATLPEADPGSFLSVTRTDDELSIVSSATEVPSGARTESGWRCLRVEGPLPFALTGVLAALSAPLAEAGVPIFVISTYDTDYLLVKSVDLERACSALRGDGHVVTVPVGSKLKV
jgi:hypothetical protein